MDYQEAFSIQERVHRSVVAGNRSHTLLLVEHEPVLTLGANFHMDNLLLPPIAYADAGIKICTTDRGGDVTYHGPGQLVAYPIFDLRLLGQDLHKWLRDLEEILIQTLARFQLTGYRFPPHTGVWVNEQKVAAIGIKVKRWVSLHGIALNCNNDLGPFDMIVPCGIRGYGVTTLSKELNREVKVSEASVYFCEAASKHLGIDFENRSLAEIE